jgi:hypothetical protein
MFNFAGKWYVSTHRKLNAFSSKWASKESFGTAFKHALEEEVEVNESLRSSIPTDERSLIDRFQSILDPKKQYMFLVCHTGDNRIVCIPQSRPKMYHVGTFCDNELTLDVDINIPKPKQQYFKNVDELLNYTQRVNIQDIQGVIVFAPNNVQYKILHPDYLKFFNARGNEPSIKFRYLQTRMDPTQSNLLYFLYPEFVKTFNDIEDTLYKIAKTIYNSYVDRFIKKQHVVVPTNEYSVIKQIHSWHEQNRLVNKISIDKVIEIMNKQEPSSLNHMIRRFNQSLKQTEEVNHPTMLTNMNTLVVKTAQVRIMTHSTSVHTEPRVSSR